MPRRAFLADVEAASKAVAFGRISDIQLGNDDGEFTFRYYIEGGNSYGSLSAFVPELSDYPDTHEYHIFLTDDNDKLPSGLSRAVQQLPNLAGIPVSAVLNKISKSITSRLLVANQDLSAESSADVDMVDAASDEADNVNDADEEDDDVENEDWVIEEEEEDEEPRNKSGRNDGAAVTSKGRGDLHSSLKDDLRAARKAGFKVGVLGIPSDRSSCYISVAIRVVKLGISEEAMDAWMLESDDYLILLLHFPFGYRSFKQLSSYDADRVKTYLEIRVLLGKKYKPTTIADALSLFSPQPSKNDSDSSKNDLTRSGSPSLLRDCFISGTLKDLMNERLMPILKCRIQTAATWESAEAFINEGQGRSAGNTTLKPSRSESSDTHSLLLPLIVMRDDLATAENPENLSLPLLAMEFLLRHFVGCTEFCLVCHCKVHSTVEAIKPYVCDKPLCLYQYMALGFGPSIEHEILTQPFVVDLLVSLCYSAVTASAMTDFPMGLGWRVPHPNITIQGTPLSHSSQLDQSNIANGNRNLLLKQTSSDLKQTHGAGVMDIPKARHAKLNHVQKELLLDPGKIKRSPVRPGDWIVVNNKLVYQTSQHYPVLETALFPTIKLGEPATIYDKKTDSKDENKPIPEWMDVGFYVYDTDFDQLDDKNASLNLLLLLMPSIVELRKYLLRKPGQTIAGWRERFPPPVAGLLRWIIASNRSCIVQVDQFERQSNNSLKGVPTGKRVQGVEGWAQFKFAMGAPDKEQRFINSIQSETASLAHPTLFCWHGSPLYNWHSIIREGLHFNKTLHGRAYGHGCYHAKDFSTSGSYSGSYSGSSGSGKWPQSELQISDAIALSEIVNAPHKYVSNNPFYVVDKLDWIQTRYLFVRLTTDIVLEGERKLTSIHPQDPGRTPKGPSKHAIVLPDCAVPQSRRIRIEHGKPDSDKKRPRSLVHLNPFSKSRTGKTKEDAIELDSESVATDDEDHAYLTDSEKSPEKDLKRAAALLKTPAEPVLPFNPDQLKDIRLMPPPPYATHMASRRLQKDFLSIRKTQDAHVQNSTLHELGWSMDMNLFNQSENLYQWIFELHSFPMSLPLAQDLQKASMQSVVLEFRFNAGYPTSPPFVRVVRPRFLAFAAGGGGHVTYGGSLCMELLTETGWSPVSDIESVLLQIRVAIMSTDPRPARLASSSKGSSSSHEYSVGEAISAFKRATILHGWRVPENLEQVAW